MHGVALFKGWVLPTFLGHVSGVDIECRDLGHTSLSSPIRLPARPTRRLWPIEMGVCLRYGSHVAGVLYGAGLGQYSPSLDLAFAGNPGRAAQDEFGARRRRVLCRVWGIAGRNRSSVPP